MAKTSQYLSTCLAGGQLLARDALVKQLSQVKIISIYDGALLYQTAMSPSIIRKLDFIHNSFQVLQILSKGKRDTAHNFLDYLELLAGKPNLLPAGAINWIYGGNKLPQTPSFCIKLVSDNQFITLPQKKYLQLLENSISRHTQLKLDINNPLWEFWLMERREGQCYFLLRLAKKAVQTMTGELRPEIANLLCRHAGMQPDDVFLDPFCGYGSIILARTKLGDFQQILAGDQQANLVKSLQQRCKKSVPVEVRGRVKIQTMDFLHNCLADASITTLVSDPPWGHYQKIDQITEFYRQLLVEAGRVLRPGGTAVLLVAREIGLDNLPEGLRLVARTDVLISGQKASICKLHKAE